MSLPRQWTKPHLRAFDRPSGCNTNDLAPTGYVSLLSGAQSGRPKSRPNGRKNSSKFLYWDEIAQVFRAGHSLLIYQHFTREVRSAFTSRLMEQLRGATGAEVVRAIHTPHVAFLLATSDPRIISLAEGLPARFGLRVECE